MAIKREAQFGKLFRHWLRTQQSFPSAAFELKQTQSNALAFDSVAPHQIVALMAAKHNSILYKAPDDSRGAKPFDYFLLAQAGAYVVIRYPAFFCLIDIDRFVLEVDQSRRKSLTATRAQAIATFTINLKALP